MYLIRKNLILFSKTGCTACISGKNRLPCNYLQHTHARYHRGFSDAFFADENSLPMPGYWVGGCGTGIGTLLCFDYGQELLKTITCCRTPALKTAVPIPGPTKSSALWMKYAVSSIWEDRSGWTKPYPTSNVTARYGLHRTIS